MSAHIRWIAEAIPPGEGWALDLGGGEGVLGEIVQKRGYRYVNLDLHPRGDKQIVCGDAHDLPFANESFMLVVAKDSLEHFEYPEKVIREVERVLKPAGTLVIWVPFMYPFHGDDYWRFTPLVLKRMLIRFRIVRFDTPLWVFSILSLAIIDLMKRMRLGCLESD